MHLAGALTCSHPASSDGAISAEDEVFRQAYIPRRLGEVADHERDHDRLTGGLHVQAVCSVADLLPHFDLQIC